MFLFTLLLSKIAFGAPADLLNLRESVRDMAAKNNCVECHMPGRSGALRRILDVYNLKNTHWAASLDDQRLVKFRERMENELKKQDLAVVDAFVKAELAFRKRDPTARTQELEQNKRERALNELGIVQNALNQPSGSK